MYVTGTATSSSHRVSDRFAKRGTLGVIAMERRGG